MKKIVKRLVLFFVLCCGILLGTNAANAAEAVPSGGTGTSGAPYILTLSDYGDYTVSVKTNGGAAYFSITFAKDGGVLLNPNSGTAYKGSGAERYSTTEETAVTANVPFTFRVGGANSKLSLTVSYRAFTTYSDAASAYDLTGVTTEQPVVIPAGANRYEETWYKFTITEPSTIIFKPKYDTDYFYFRKEDGVTDALSGKNFYDASAYEESRASSGMYPFYALDENIFVPTNTTKIYYSTEHSIKDGVAKLSFYEAGTYYMICNGDIGKANEEKGFESFLLRPYKPIESVVLSAGGFKDPKNIKITEGKASLNVINNIMGFLPEDADGHIVSLDYDKSFFSRDANTLGGETSGLDLTGKFGNRTVKLVDERGENVDSYKVSLIPRDILDIGGTGTVNSASVHIGNANSESAADSVRIYIKKGSKYSLYKTYTPGGRITSDTRFTISGLKANTNYNIKLTNYDKATDTESAMSKEFKIGTAPSAKPVIKSVKNIKISKETGTLIYNSGKWNERREKYTYYAARGTITVKKVKGASSYNFNLYGTSCPNYLYNKTSGNLRLVKGGKTAASVKGTIKLKCQVAKKINGYFTAYGNWGSVKAVKIK